MFVWYGLCVSFSNDFVTLCKSVDDSLIFSYIFKTPLILLLWKGKNLVINRSRLGISPSKPGNLEPLQVQPSRAAQRVSLQRHPPAWQQLACKGNMFCRAKTNCFFEWKCSKSLEIVFISCIGIHRNPWKTKKVKKVGQRSRQVL